MCQDKNNLGLSTGDRKPTVQAPSGHPLPHPNNRGSILNGSPFWSGSPLTFIKLKSAFISLSLMDLGRVICKAYNSLILPPYEDHSSIVNYYLPSPDICQAKAAVLDRIIVHLHMSP